MYNRKSVLRYIEKEQDFLNGTVKENIEKYRKGDACVKITDKNGAPLSNARVKIKQLSHEFKFGANIFMLDELETPEKNEKYKKAPPKILNLLIFAKKC